MTNPHVGSSFEDCVKNEGTRDAAHAHAIKGALAWLITGAMKIERLTKREMPKRMSTSRAQLYRLLDLKNDKVQLDTL